MDTRNSPDAPAWPHVYRPGTGPTIITLHGYGGNEVEVSDLGTWIHPDATVISPRGQLVEGDTIRWYGRFTGQQFDPVDINDRAAQLMSFLRDAARHYSFSLPDAIVTGFSNGGAMAAALGVLYPDEVTHVGVFSGVLPFNSLPPTDLSSTSVWSSRGDSDMWVSDEAGRHLIDLLTSRGARVGSLVRPGGHGITDEEVVQARGFFFAS